MRIAAAQVRSALFDSAAGTESVLHWLGRAAGEGVELLAFPETFLGGYPVWLSPTGGARFNDPLQKAAYAAYLDAAVELGGGYVSRIVEAVRDLKVFTYLGTAERAGHTVYCTLLAIDPAAGIVGVHRKLMPTYEERLVWGMGDGHGLRTHTVNGARVGGLNCWENWMPQARHALYADGEQVHVSVWPGSTRLTKDITRFIALEGRVFSLAAGALIDYEGADYDGGSAIAAPDGRWLVEPASGREGLVTADIDPGEVARERQNFDPTGHYSRPDVFSVAVDRQRRSPVRWA